MVIVVSEETAKVSVARGGQIEQDVSSDRLREILEGAVPDSRGVSARSEQRALA